MADAVAAGIIPDAEVDNPALIAAVWVDPATDDEVAVHATTGRPRTPRERDAQPARARGARIRSTRSSAREDESAVKIARIEPIRQTLPLEPPFDAAVVRVSTSEGIIGNCSGDTMDGFEPYVELFLGQDPFHITCSAGDHRVPLRPTPAYASTGPLPPVGDRVESVLAMREQGFRAVKIRLAADDSSTGGDHARDTGGGRRGPRAGGPVEPVLADGRGRAPPARPPAQVRRRCVSWVSSGWRSRCRQQTSRGFCRYGTPPAYRWPAVKW